MKPRQLLALIALAFICVITTRAQTAPAPLVQEHEKELSGSNTALANAPAGTSDAARATLLKEKANALDSLGRSVEALTLMQEALRLSPDDLSIQMHAAVVYDSTGDHTRAAEMYESIQKKLQETLPAPAKTTEEGEKPKKITADLSKLAVALALPEHMALNYVFLGKDDKALGLFTRIYTVRGELALDDATDYAALWRLYLTAKIRASNDMRASTAIDILTVSLRVTTPYHEAVIKLYQGKGHWQKILKAIDDMKISEAEKENYRTEAHFFVAGYYRFIKRDTATALELLNAENARPFNGCVERLLIKNELDSIKTQQ